MTVAVEQAVPDARVVRDGSFVGVLHEREEVAVKAIEAAAAATRWDAGAADCGDLMDAIEARLRGS